MKYSILTACLFSVGLGLSGCATPSQTFAPTHLNNAINVAESIERLELYTRPNGMELSARDKLAVAQFLDGYARSGDGALYINRPASAMSGLGTQQAEATIRGLMAQGGMNPAAVQTGQYASRPGAPAPVVVSYRTLRAIPQNCREASGQPNAQRRQVIYDKYIQGEPTAAQVNPDQRVEASE